MTGFNTPGCEPFADLLGVYALDALDPDEAVLVADHIASCPRCAQEIDDHRETMGLLAAGGGPAPEGVWDRIASSISPETPGTNSLPTLRIMSAPRKRAQKARPLWAAAIAIAAAAAVVVGVQTSRIDRLNHKVDQLSTAARQTGGFQGLAAALVDPAAHHYTLTSTNPSARPVGQLIVLPSGVSYFVGSRLAPLASDRTYQLWSMIGGRAESVGLLGARPGSSVALTVDPSVRSRAYLVTVEPAGGVVAPTSAPVAHVTL